MSFPPVDPPGATLFMFGLAATISLLTSLVNRLLSDPKKSKEWRKEISDWNKELRAAQRSDDKKTVDKLMKKQQQIFKLQSKMMWQSMKVTLIFIVPLFLIWQVLGGIYANHPVAYFPGAGPDLQLLIIALPSLVWWYLLCSFLFGTVFSHFFGIVEVSE